MEKPAPHNLIYKAKKKNAWSPSKEGDSVFVGENVIYVM